MSDIVNPPKKPRSAYILFSADARPKLVAANPDMKPQEVLKALGTQWSNLEAKEKKKYQDKNQEEKERYARELDEYIAAGGDPDAAKKGKKSGKKSKQENKMAEDPNPPNEADGTLLCVKARDVAQSHKGNKGDTFDHHKINAIISEHPKLRCLRIMENSCVKNFVDLPQKLKVDQSSDLEEVSIESSHDIALGRKKAKIPNYLQFIIITFNPQTKKGVLDYIDVTAVRADNGNQSTDSDDVKLFWTSMKRFRNRIPLMKNLKSLHFKGFWIGDQRELFLWKRFFGGLVNKGIYKTLEEVKIEVYSDCSIEEELKEAFKKCKKVECVEIQLADPGDFSETHDVFGREMREDKWGPDGYGWTMFPDWRP